MLAQNFMTAETLNISEQFHSALITLLGMMERGEIPDKAFTMAWWRRDIRDISEARAPECGTACCIGGWAEYLARVEHGAFYGEAANSAESLCYPQRWVMLEASSAHGALAIRNYLTTGDAKWPEVLGS